MRLLELVGSIFLAVYIIGLLVMTSINLSKWFFAYLNPEKAGAHFWARQGMIFLWPLTLISAEGRNALVVIWKGDYE